MKKFVGVLVVAVALCSLVFAQEANWDETKWAQVIRETMDRFRGNMYTVTPAEWEKHESDVSEWLNRQKIDGAIAMGGCYTSFGTKPFATFWYRENAKRFRGEPHYQPVSWVGITGGSEQDKQENVDQVIHYCAYQAAPDKAAPNPPRPGEVAQPPAKLWIPKSQGDEPEVFPVVKTVRNVVGSDAKPPPNPTPIINFSSRYTDATLSNQESPFKFRDVFDAANGATSGVCTADVTVFTDVANHNLCANGIRDNLAYKITIKFFPLVTKSWQWRLGPSFSFGGSLFVDGQAEDSRAENLDWKGDWGSSDVYVTPRRMYAKGKWHEIVYYGVSGCCDGPMAIQFDTGSGWTEGTVKNVLDAQVSGWTADGDIDGFAIGRGEGVSSFSVVESGVANFGSHQNSWALHDQDGVTSFVRRIEFGVFFNWAPVVQVYLRRLDSSRDSNVRVFVRAKNVDSNGFDLEIVKYGESRVYQVGVSWFAFDADPMYGTKFGHVCAKGSYLDNKSLPGVTPSASTPSAAEQHDLLLALGPDYKTVPLQQYTLHEFSGFRKYEMAVPFRDQLPTKPTQAFVGINMLDADRKTNLVTAVKLFNLGTRGLDFEFNAAGTSRIFAEGACALTWNPVRREIETGTVNMGALVHGDAWNLDEGRGLREFYQWVSFRKRFQEPPSVVVAISHLNVPTQHNVRFDVTVAEVTSRGFRVRVATWGQSELVGITVSWFATADGRTNGLSPDTPGEKQEIFKDPRVRQVYSNDGEWDLVEAKQKSKLMDHDDDARIKV